MLKTIADSDASIQRTTMCNVVNKTVMMPCNDIPLNIQILPSLFGDSEQATSLLYGKTK